MLNYPIILITLHLFRSSPCINVPLLCPPLCDYQAMQLSIAPILLVTTVIVYQVRAQKPGNVLCGKSTTVPINGETYKVGPGESYTIQTRKMTRRCVVTYEVTYISIVL